MNIDFRLLQITPCTLLIDAMSIITEGAAQIALVVDEKNHLVGTLTDGDIRRGLLLHGETLQSQAKRLMNTNFRFVRIGEDKLGVLEMMRRERVHQIPVLDADGRISELLLLEELISPSHLTNAVVIMAGGKGTRLRPQTENCPKPMLAIDGKPMLELLIEQCIHYGLHQFYLSVNYLKEQIIDYFEDGSRWGVSINYLVEDKPLGTAGSLHLLPNTVTEPFLVLNGDVLTRFNLSQLLQFHNKCQASATMSVREHEITVPFGVVKVNGIELVGFEEKPCFKYLINAGVYVVNPKLLTLLAPNEFIHMPSFLHSAQVDGHSVAVCPIHEYWIDVGRPETLKEANSTWSNDA